MAPRTLRELLSLPNPVFEVTSDNQYDNSSKTNQDQSSLDDIDLWSSIESDLESVFGKILNASIRGIELPSTLPPELCMIRDERAFELVLSRHNNVIVNEALRLACEMLDIPRITWLTGSAAPNTGIFPDWAVVHGDRSQPRGHTINVIPGDSKIDLRSGANFLIRSGDDFKLDDRSRSWLRQVHSYAMKHESRRYCYIITDQELMLMRI